MLSKTIHFINGHLMTLSFLSLSFWCLSKIETCFRDKKDKKKDKENKKDKLGQKIMTKNDFF